MALHPAFPIRHASMPCFARHETAVLDSQQLAASLILQQPFPWAEPTRHFSFMDITHNPGGLHPLLYTVERPQVTRSPPQGWLAEAAHQAYHCSCTLRCQGPAGAQPESSAAELEAQKKAVSFPYSRFLFRRSQNAAMCTPAVPKPPPYMLIKAEPGILIAFTVHVQCSTACRNTLKLMIRL